LTAAAVLGIAFTPPLKTDEKCRQKAELRFAECNFQNSTLNNCFCSQKAE